MYSIVPNLAKHRVRVVFANDFEHEQDAFNAELKSAIDQVRADDGHFDLLSDFTDAPVMSQERAKQGEEMVAWCLANGLRRSANVMGTVLQRLQIKRVSANDEKFAYFETCSEAENWLES